MDRKTIKKYYDLMYTFPHGYSPAIVKLYSCKKCGNAFDDMPDHSDLVKHVKDCYKNNKGKQTFI